MCWRERDLIREGKPPGCCDKPYCPWRHVNDPAESGAHVGATSPAVDDPTGWPVCRHVVDPTRFGTECPGPNGCGRSHCPLAGAFIRKQIHPNSRNSGPGPRRQTPDRDRRSPHPRADRRTPSRSRDRRDRDRSTSRRSSREGRGDRRRDDRSAGRERRQSREKDHTSRGAGGQRETRPKRPDFRGLPGAGGLGAADNGHRHASNPSLASLACVPITQRRAASSWPTPTPPSSTYLLRSSNLLYLIFGGCGGWPGGMPGLQHRHTRLAQRAEDEAERDGHTSCP